MNTNKFLNNVFSEISIFVWFLSIIVLVANPNTLMGQEKEMPQKEVESEIKEVVVYLNSAQINRKGSINIPAGKTQLLFTKLPPSLDASSLQIQGEGDFTILSVSTKRNYLEESLDEYDEQTTKIRDEIKGFDKQLKLLNASKSILEKEEAMLMSNQQIISPHRPGSVTELNEASRNLRTRLNEIYTEKIDLEDKISDITEEKTVLGKQLKDLEKTETKSFTEAVVNVESKTTTKGNFEISYLVSDAGWFINYDLRVADIESPIDLTSKASVRQGTGEDWNNVKLSLSTGDPTQSGVKPELKPYYLEKQDYRRNRGAVVGYNKVQVSGVYNGSVSGIVKDEFGEPLIGVAIVVEGTTMGTVTDFDGNYNLQIPAGSSYLIFSYVGYSQERVRISGNVINVIMDGSNLVLEEVVVSAYGASKERKAKRKKTTIPVPVKTNQNTTVFEYTIKTPYTVLSDYKPQSIAFQQIELPADYKYFAVPKIDNDAFLLAQIVDWEQYNLLQGEVNLYFEGKFLGKSILNTETSTDTLLVSLGRDKNIVIERNIVKEFSKKQFLVGKKSIAKAWEISVRNNKAQAITIVIEDQVPVSNDNDVEVEVKELSKGELKEKTGFVSWSLEVKPKETKKLDLQYTVKYPRRHSLRVE